MNGKGEFSLPVLLPFNKTGMLKKNFHEYGSWCERRLFSLMIFVLEINTNTMLSGFSWIQYVVFLMIVTTVYYGIVLFMFYKKDFIAYLNRSGKISSAGEINITGDNIAKAFIPDTIDPGMLQHEIHLLLKEAAGKKLIKEEIIISLQILLGPYPSLQSSSLKESVNNYIITQTENICSIHLDEQNVNQVWLR